MKTPNSPQPGTPTLLRTSRDRRIWAEAYSLGRSEAFRDGIIEGRNEERKSHDSRRLEIYARAVDSLAQVATSASHIVRAMEGVK